MTDDDTTPLLRLQSAVQAFVNETSDEPVMVSSAVVLWEAVTYEGEKTLFEVDFASVGAQESMMSALGMVVYAQAKMTSDLVDGTDGDDVD